MNYEKIKVDKDLKEKKTYCAKEILSEEEQKIFLRLKANVADLNKSMVKKCLQGLESDYLNLLKRVDVYLLETEKLSKEEASKMRDYFCDYVFGYYILSPLLDDERVSDIKVIDYNHVTVKVSGERMVSDVSFISEADFSDWAERLLILHKVSKKKGLFSFSDRFSRADSYLRIDVQKESITSTEKINLHIRKIPKEKFSWEYLKECKMLDESMKEYMKNRIAAGYGFLISGKGGSGKSTLLNNLLDEISYSESVLVSQESDELYSNVHPQMQFEHTICASNGEEEVSLEDELRLGLLQDIDNFVIGEIKGAEALYVFTTALSTGARFFGTIHANDARSSVLRLAWCARFASDYSVENLKGMLSGVSFVLIHMSHFAIDEIVEIVGFDDKKNDLIYKQIYGGEK